MKNHSLSQAYLRGFCGPTGLLEERDHRGAILRTNLKPDQICYESTPPEPGIESLRQDVESFWGRFRETHPRELLSRSNLGQRTKVAKFLSLTILLSRSGREIVRNEREGKESNPTWAEDIVIGETSTALENRFLALQGLVIKPACRLLCGEVPAVFQFDFGLPGDNVEKILQVWFPLSQHYLLLLNPNQDAYLAHDDGSDAEMRSNSPVVMAHKHGIDANEGLVERAGIFDSKIYTATGHDWSCFLHQ